MDIPITKPLIDDKEIEAVRSPLETGWLVQGPFVRRFEEMVAQYCEVPYAVATSSCTSALHLSLVAAGIGSGDEVLVPSFTYVATANAVEHAGARPVFIDIDPNTLNLSTDALEVYLETCEKKGLPFPRAVIPVHLFGLCADMEPHLKLAEKYGLLMIEDAACALGSGIQGKSAGTFGNGGCFSFHPRKVITTGEGGMVVTGDEQTAAAVRMLRDHGAEISDHARHESGLGELPEFNRPGFNYRMTDLQGALGTTQMLKLPGILRERARRAVEYDRLLGDVSWFRTPFCPEGFTHTYQSYVCRIEIPDRTPEQLGKVRGRLMKHLDAAGIAARPGTHAVHLLGYYKKKYGLRPEHCPDAMKAHFNTITFPLYPEMTEEEQTHVVKSISTFNP